MKTLKFHIAEAYNFLPFGPEGIKIDFDALGKIVFIRGENRDVKPLDSIVTDEARMCSNGSGKCFRKNTRILMYDGTIKMVQDVKVGDQVMGPDSEPRNVLSLGSGKEMMYEIKPKKGESYFVNKSHILSLKPLFRKNPCKTMPALVGEVLNISVLDFLNLPQWKQNLYGTYRKGVNFDEQKTPIDPYLFGVWLGDGHSHTATFTSQDEEILDVVRKEAENRKLQCNISNKKNKTLTIAISSYRKSGKKTDTLNQKLAREIHKDGYSLLEVSQQLNCSTSSAQRWSASAESEYTRENSYLINLKELNVLNNKHIPQIYKINSRKFRLELLAGLIDSDGTVDSTGFSFTNKNKSLAYDVAFVARSLGLAANVNEVQKKCCNNGKIGTYYNVTIYGDCQEIPVKLPHKQLEKRIINKDHLKSAISVIPVGIEEYFGFTVDGDNLFLLDSFTVVHNSSIPDILAWTIYGKTVKNPKKIKVDDVINNLIGEKCKTVLVVDNIRIERGRAPNFLRLWKSDDHIWDKDTELTQGTMADTQKKIIDDHIGLSYEAFVNICVFADDSSSCFLECDTPKKREIVENLLSLDVYRLRHETANNELKSLKNNIKLSAKEFEVLLNNKTNAEKRVNDSILNEKNWKSTKLAEMKAIIEQIKAKTEELGKSDNGAALLAYQQAQDDIESTNLKIAALEESRAATKRIVDEEKEKENLVKDEGKVVLERGQEIQRVIKDYQYQINQKTAFVNDLKGKDVGNQCDKCWSVIDSKNFQHACDKTVEEIDDLKAKLEVQNGIYNKIVAEAKEVKARQLAIKAVIDANELVVNKADAELRTMHANLTKWRAIKEPQTKSAELLAEQKIAELKDRAKAKKMEYDGDSPFVEIITNNKIELENAIKVCEDKEIEIKAFEKKQLYYEYWVKAFGDKGIRKWVVDGIIPALNNRIAYWLQFLIENKISLKFDNELNETIERNPVDGDPYIYHAMSAGQRRRLNLAVSQAFAHIMMLSTGTIPSVVFLDEISTNIDPQGVLGLFNMINEFTQEKQVFVTTHDQDLIKMLQGVDVIDLVHEHGITKII